MALNLQTLKTRSLTAVVFVAVMLVGLLWNFWSFLILFTVVHFGCWLEYMKLVEKIHNTTIDNFVKWFFAVCGYTLMIVAGIQHHSFDIGITIGGFEISFKWLFFILLFVGLTVFAVQNKMIPAKTKWMVFGGFVYISLALTLLLNLRHQYDFSSLLHKGSVLEYSTMNNIFLSVLFPIAIVFSIWINDTMAYIVGSLIGKTPLSKISPKKTWEGTVGGALLCILFIGILFSSIFGGSLINGWYFAHVSKADWFIIAALCAIFGTIGDLFESKLKRMAGVKDSGSIMPGHGGFLDRFDSLLFAVPAVWVYVKLFM
jgi:phosphatidate cytidylyltransferase